MKKTTTRLLLLLALLPAALPCAAQRAARSAADSELLKYIRSEGADAACGVCLAAAQRQAEKADADRLKRRTVGMALVPGGKYRVGSPQGVGDPDEKPAADVSLDAFYIDRNEVTLGDYVQFARATGGNYPEWLKPGGRYNIATGTDKYYRRLDGLIKTCDNCPVFGVTWEDAGAYCAWKKRRLPTEAEWEAAARAGSAETYAFGESELLAGTYAWLEDNSGEVPHPVGTRKANKFGLNDMQGNVWEWVADFYGKTYYEDRPSRDPQGPRLGEEHIIRGGSWASDADSGRPANRAANKKPNDDIGFRCAISESELSKEPGL